MSEKVSISKTRLSILEAQARELLRAKKDWIEFCHRRLEPSGEWCGNEAEFIVWGKLYPADALGPRCYDCAAEQVGHRSLSDPHHAVLDLRKLTNAERS